MDSSCVNAPGLQRKMSASCAFSFGAHCASVCSVSAALSAAVDYNELYCIIVRE